MKKVLFFILISFCANNTFAQIPSYVDTNGLLAWYPFDSSAVNAYSLTWDNGVLYGDASYGTDRYGIRNRCYLGDGTSGIDIPTNNFVTGNGARSVASWYKMPLPAPTGNRELFATGDNSAVGHRFGLNTDVTWIGWESVGLGVDYPLPVDSAWHHLVITYPAAGSGSASIKTYFDGVLRATTYIGGTVPILNTAANPIHCIGTLFMPVSYGSWLYSWIGKLDDMGVWDREISACDVAYLYYGGNGTLAFARSHVQHITVCENGTISLNSILAVNDSDVGLTDTWSTYVGPLHGTLVSAYSTISTGSTMTPTGLSYSPSFGYLGTDSFKVIVKDCNNTADTTTVIITISPLLAVGVISGPSVVCSGSSITLTDTPSGGAWSAANGSATVAGGVVTGVVAGTNIISYSVTNGCGTTTATKTITINTTPAAPVVTGTTTYCQFDVYTAPIATGANILWYTSASGGTGSAATPVINTSTPGVYNFYVSQSSSGCESTRTPFTITVNPKPATPGITDVPDIYCPNQLFVPFTTSGSNILWYTSGSGGTGSSVSPGINTAVPGVYTVWATQTVLGCESDRASYSVTVVDNVHAGFTFNVGYGCTADTVVFTNTSTGTDTYTWIFGDISPIAIDSSPTHVYHFQGIDTVILYASSANCIDSVKKPINLVHPIQALFSADTNLICQGGSITFTNSSVATGATYLWNFGDGSTLANVINPTHAYPNTGVYKAYLAVTDFVPCHDTAYVTISVDTISPIYIAQTDSVLCTGTYVTFTGTYSSIGNTGITWNFGNGDSIKNINPVSFAYDAPGTYTITASATYRVCKDTSTFRSVTIEPQPAINIGPDTSICKGGNPIILIDRLNAGAGKAAWLWNTGSTSSQITVIEPGTYSVAVKLHGCSASASVNVVNDCYMNIPNVFSPNGDGLNDYFYPRNELTSGLITFNMEIYNRWGEEIFASSTLDGRGWDGRFNNVDQPEGAYVYVIDATFKDGQKEHHQGNVTLIR